MREKQCNFELKCNVIIEIMESLLLKIFMKSLINSRFKVARWEKASKMATKIKEGTICGKITKTLKYCLFCEKSEHWKCWASIPFSL